MNESNCNHKKAIIFSGPMASGKSYISIGIAGFFPIERVKFFTRAKHLNLPPLKSKFLENIDLAIFDELENYEAIQEFEKFMEELPNCNFIFNTHYPLSYLDIDTKKYHLVVCKPF